MSNAIDGLVRTLNTDNYMPSDFSTLLLAAQDMGLKTKVFEIPMRFNTLAAVLLSRNIEAITDISIAVPTVFYSGGRYLIELASSGPMTTRARVISDGTGYMKPSAFSPMGVKYKKASVKTAADLEFIEAAITGKMDSLGYKAVASVTGEIGKSARRRLLEADLLESTTVKYDVKVSYRDRARAGVFAHAVGDGLAFTLSHADDRLDIVFYGRRPINLTRERIAKILQYVNGAEEAHASDYAKACTITNLLKKD